MLCPKCGAYSPYNTAVCNRCGTKLLGKNAGKSPRNSRSQQYYRRTRQSDWEKNRDQFLSRANDKLDGIMADRSKRRLLIAALAVAAAVIIGSTAGCISCACGGCGSCSGCSGSDVQPVVSATEAEGGSSGGGGSLLHNLLGSSETVSGSDETGITSGTDAPELSGSDTQPPQIIEAKNEDLVSIDRYIPDIHIDVKYATKDNFTGQVIYDSDRPLLRYGTVKKLMAVQDELRAMGLSLKIWDGFRPTQAQFRLWEICPDPRYVSDPNVGFSGHSRGNTVDLTVVNADGSEIPMPTGYDDFTALADRDYSDVPKEAAENAVMLEELMTRYGFRGYTKEWWHYTDVNDYPVVED